MRESNRRELESLSALRQKAEGIIELNPYTRRTKSVQFIYIFKNVGLMNQAPTIKSNPFINKSAGLINQIPTRIVGLMNQAPTNIPGKVSYYSFFFLS
jgi:hypothetical protein